MIAVLEAPIFKVPDSESPVVQYVRKGEEIYIHPAEFSQDRYEGLINMPKEDIDSYHKTYAKDFKDPLFKNKEDTYVPMPESNFYKTLSNSGQDAYILKEHVFLLYNDTRELTQEVASPDNTDYRIEEPLPKGYPIEQPSGERGYVSVGLGVPSAPSYDYTSKIDDTGFGFYKEFNLVWGKNGDKEITKRFYFGGLVSITSSSVDYKLGDRLATEDHFTMSAGPLAIYDFWRNNNYRLSIQGSIQLVFLDQLEITQDGDDDSDTRSFNNIHFSPRIGLAFQKPKAIRELDFVAGANVNYEPSRNYSALDSASVSSWWRGNDFTRPSYIQVSYFLGLQHSY